MVDCGTCLSVCSSCEPGKPPPCCPASRWNWPEVSAFRTFLLMITAPSCAFLVFVCPYLARNISPAVLYIAVAGYALSSTMLFLTSFSDPGTVQKSTNIKRHVGRYDIREVVIKDTTFELKYCVTCGIYRPPRCSHCRECNRCVDKWDHHCPWVGNCVGRRNYRCFIGFVASTTVLCVYVCAFSVVAIYMRTSRAFREAAQASPTGKPQRPSEPVLVALEHAPVELILVVYTFVVALLLFMLAMYHTYLISVNETTNENVKDVFMDGNPFSEGCVHNCGEAFGCVRVPTPTLMPDLELQPVPERGLLPPEGGPPPEDAEPAAEPAESGAKSVEEGPIRSRSPSAKRRTSTHDATPLSAAQCSPAEHDNGDSRDALRRSAARSSGTKANAGDGEHDADGEASVSRPLLVLSRSHSAGEMPAHGSLRRQSQLEETSATDGEADDEDEAGADGVRAAAGGRRKQYQELMR